jgi:phage tail protein X
MKNIHPSIKGAKVLSKEQSNEVDLGPLTGFLGTWASQPGDGMGWNVIAVPGSAAGVPDQGFVLEVIPYHETWSFTPAVIAGNRGLADEQTVVGLIYEQKVFSDCSTKFCADRGFAKGTEIHAETGMLLNMTNFSTGLDIARLGTIPHGNAIMLLGAAIESTGKFDFPDASSLPTLVTGAQPPLGYSEAQYFNQQFPDFPQNSPNDFLAETVKDQTFGKVTTLKLTSQAETGGVLNIPFIRNNVDVPKMTCEFWLEEILDAKGNTASWQLQYSQTIDIVFPPSTNPTGPKFIWPHIDINTMQKVD